MRASGGWQQGPRSAGGAAESQPTTLLVVMVQQLMPMCVVDVGAHNRG